MQLDLQELLRWLLTKEHGPEIKAVFLCGSYAWGTQDGNSDIDLLVVTSGQDRFASEVWHGVEVEIHFGSAETLRRQASRPAMDNNNLIVNLLAWHILLWQQGEEGTRFLADVEAKCCELNLQPTAPQLQTAHDALRKLLSATERAAARATEDAWRQWFLRMRTDNVINRCVYLRWWMQGERTDALAKLVRRSEERFPELYALVQAYVQSREMNVQAVLALQCGNATLTRLKDMLGDHGSTNG